MTKRFVGCLLGAALLAAWTGAAAQGFPTRAIELIIPAPPGGPTDAAARVVAQALAGALGVPVAPINKPGALTIPGTDAVAKTAPDGYTIGALTNAGLTIVTAIERPIPYKIADFTPLGVIASDVTVVTVRADSPIKSLADLVQHAKANPGKLTYASAGVGSVNSIGMELVKLAFSLEITHVPHQGTGPANTAVLGGHVVFGATSLSATLPLIRGNELRALVTASPGRIAQLGGVPTIAEQGHPESILNFWTGLFVPAKTPPDVVAKLAATLERVMKTPATIEQIEKLGVIYDYRGPDATRKLMDDEIKTVTKVAKVVNLK